MTGCLICGSSLVYFSERNSQVECAICGKDFLTNVLCENGHYVCDECHKKEAIRDIIMFAKKADSKNPAEILTALLNHKAVHMHGPEHHILVGASILAAYCNCKHNAEPEKFLKEMLIRGRQLPGGTCGFWGACGAALSAGAAYSILTETTPMSTKTWGNANLLTSEILAAIGSLGGPRCCKRTSYLAVIKAAEFINSHMDVSMDISKNIICRFSHRNKECLK